MQKFNKFCIDRFKEFVYQSNIHDSIIKGVDYNREKRILSINVVNYALDSQIYLKFYGVKSILLLNGDIIGSTDTILSFTVEENYNFLQNENDVEEKCVDDSICVMFQMFSGDEIYIAFTDVTVDAIG